MVIFNTDHCLKLSLASLHHTDGTYGLERLKQDFNEALKAINIEAVDWSNTQNSPEHQLDFATFTANNTPQVIGLDYLDTEFCKEQCWGSDQLDIYFDHTPQNLINLILISIVLKEQTYSHAYLDIGTKVGVMYGGDHFELYDSYNIANVIKQYDLENKFVDYLKSLNENDGSNIAIELCAPAGESKRLIELNDLIVFPEFMNEKSKLKGVIHAYFINAKSAAEMGYISVADKTLFARYNIAKSSTGEQSLVINADYSHNSKLIFTKLAELIINKHPDFKITLFVRNEKFNISSSADIEALLTKLNKSPIY